MANSAISDRIHAVTMVAAAGLTAAFWAEWFGKGRVKVADDPVYVTFEEAFPLADAYMATCFILAARSLWSGKPAAIPLGIAGGSSLVFLALMDLLFDLRRGTLTDNNAEMRVEQAIIASSLIYGPVTMARLWRRRDALTG